MKKILTYFRPYKWQALLGPLFKLLEATFELLVPFVVAKIVDDGLGAFENGGYPHADKGFVVSMCIVLAVFGLVGLLFSVTAQYFSARAATGVSARVRSDLFKKLQSLSYKDIDKMGEATMLTRMTSDVDKMQTGINLFLRLLLRSPFIVFGALVCACIIDPSSFWVFGGAIVILAIVVYAVMFICMPLYKKTQSKLDNVLLSTRENLAGARVLRAFCKDEDERAIFQERNDGLTKERKFVSGMNRRYKLLFSHPLAASKVPKDAWVQLHYTFTPNIPNNLLEEAQIASQLEGIVSDATKLKVLSIVDDVQAELKKIEEENKALEQSVVDCVMFGVKNNTEEEENEGTE